MGTITNMVLENFVNIADPANPNRLPPSWNSLGNGDFNLVADGYQFYPYDDGAFAYQRISGDFDVSVRLAAMEALRPETSAGLMVRETLDDYSRTLHVLARPAGVTQDGRVGAGAFLTFQRSVSGESTYQWDSGYVGGTVSLPHAWMRLRRQAQSFTAYWSDDGINWTQIGQHTATDAYPREVYVGLGVTSGYNGQSAHFEFRSYRNLVSTLVTIPDVTMNEEQLVSIGVKASDPDVPLQALAFSLGAGVPTGASINTNTGVFTWTPVESQGPGTYPISVIVTDNGPPPLSATNTFTITVNEVNVAPVLGALSNYTVNAGQTVSFTATATDADVPLNALLFSLLSSPAGATITSSGLFKWRPGVALANTTNVVQVMAQDNGVPVSNDTRSFTVVVNPLAAPVVLTPLGYSNGQFTLGVTGPFGPDYVIMGSTNLQHWNDLTTNPSPVLPFQHTDPQAGSFSNRVYRVRLGP
jgi:hypothetical protein